MQPHGNRETDDTPPKIEKVKSKAKKKKHKHVKSKFHDQSTDVKQTSFTFSINAFEWQKIRPKYTTSVS